MTRLERWELADLALGVALVTALALLAGFEVADALVAAFRRGGP